jgi:hypothetical protein
MNATIQFTCPQCNHQMNLPSSTVGKQGKCPGCGEVVTITSAVCVPGAEPGAEPGSIGGSNPQASPAESPFAIKIDSPQHQASSNKTQQHSKASGSKTTAKGMPVLSLVGPLCLLEVFEDKVAITPKGMGVLTTGFIGTREIYYTSIVGIQFKEAGSLPGHMELMLKGNNHFIFQALSKKNNAQAREIKNYIEAALRTVSTPQAPDSLSDELHKLAELRQQGLLLEAEFLAAKQKLIG